MIDRIFGVTILAGAIAWAAAVPGASFQVTQRAEEVSEVGTVIRQVIRTPEGTKFSLVYPHGWNGRLDASKGAIQLVNPAVEGTLIVKIGGASESGARGKALAREWFLERFAGGTIQEEFEAYSMDGVGQAVHGSVKFGTELRYTVRVAAFEYGSHYLEVAVQAAAPQFEQARLAWAGLLNTLQREAAR